MTNQKKSIQKSSKPKQIYRSETNRVIGGVCGGIGEFFSVDPVIIRILFILFAIYAGSGVLLYIILWVIIPSKSSLKKTSDTTIKENVEEIKGKAEEAAREIQEVSETDIRLFIGLLLLFCGVIFLLNNFGFVSLYSIKKLWPLAIIVFGLFLLVRGQNE